MENNQRSADQADNSPNKNKTGKQTAWLLAFAGISPIALLAIMLAITPPENALFPPLMDAFKTCSVIGIAFLGGVRWGMELQSMNPKILIASTVPAVLGWGCLFLPEPISIGILLIIVAALGAWDTFSVYSGSAPQWYARLRSVITLLAAIFHMIVLAAAFHG